MPLPPRAPRRDRGSSLTTLALALAVALPAAALGAMAQRLLAPAPRLVSPLPDRALPTKAARASLPREAEALRQALDSPSVATVTAELLTRLGLVGEPSDASVIEPYLGSRSVLVRQAALTGLALLGTERAVEQVAAWARGPVGDGDVYTAIAVLGRSEHPLAEAVLLELAGSGEMWRSESALTALATRGGPAARKLLHAQLRDGPLHTAWSAAMNVARLGEAQDGRLLMGLAAGNGDRARAALSALGMLQGGQTDRFLIELAATATGARRGELLDALGSVRDPAALAILEDAVRGAPRWRGNAWNALGRSEAPGALELMIALLPDSTPSDSSSVANAFAARPEPEARETLRALAAGDDLLASAALASLCGVEDPSAVELLLARYDADGRFPPPETMSFLATRGGEAGWTLIEEVLAEGSTNDRSSVVWALQMRGDGDARTRLVALAQGEDPMLAPQAMGALEGMGEDARDALRELLVERVAAGETNDFGQSMATLGRLGGDEARELLLGRMQDGTTQEQAHALSALAGMDDPLAREAIRDTFAHSEDPTLRRTALGALLWSPDGPGAEVMDLALQDSDPSVVAEALAALPHAQLDDAGERLQGFLRADDPSVRSAALGALAQTGGPEAEEALVTALADPELAGTAVWSLQSLGTQGAREALRDAASSDDPMLRSQALGALGQDPSPAASELLSAGLRSDDEQVVTAAVNALQARGTSAAAEELAALLERSEEEMPGVASQIAWALSAIGGRVFEEHREAVERIQGANGMGSQDGLGAEWSVHDAEWSEGLMLLE